MKINIKTDTFKEHQKSINLIHTLCLFGLGSITGLIISNYYENNWIKGIFSTMGIIYFFFCILILISWRKYNAERREV